MDFLPKNSEKDAKKLNQTQISRNLTLANNHKSENQLMFESFAKEGFATKKQKPLLSKDSISTLSSIELAKSKDSGSQPFDELNFTFNNIQNDTLSSESSSRYSHSSPYSVIIFGILFNHLHLQKELQELPGIKKLSQHLTDTLKLVFRNLED